MKNSKRKAVAVVLLILTASLVAFGLVIANTATKPMDISLRCHIQICAKTDKGWQVIDEVGPANLRFKASLMDMADKQQLGTGFNWSTRTKKGKPYSVRLLGRANASFNHLNGKFDAELKYDINYDGQRAIVPAKLTTDTQAGPLGSLRGRRAKGIFGQDKSSLTVVSANRFQPERADEHLLLVCKEEYTMTPADAGRK